MATPEQSAVRTLQEILIKTNKQSTITAEQFLELFKQKKYNEKLHVGALKSICKHIPEIDRHLGVFRTNCERNVSKLPYTSLIVFLNNLPPPMMPKVIPTDLPRKATSLSSAKTTSMFDSPELCSTRVSDSQLQTMKTNNVQNQVLEVKEKLAQVTMQTQHTSRITSTPNNYRSPTSAIPSYYKSTKLSDTSSQHSSTSVWNFNFNGDNYLPNQTQKNIIAIPATAQERVIITELLYCLIGIRGSLIVPKVTSIPNDSFTFKGSEGHQSSQSTIEFTINQVPETIRDILSEILPLASNYSMIQSFVESAAASKSGQVLQALSAALRKLMNDYFASIAHLEGLHLKHQLNLHKLLYFLRPIMHTMEIIAQSVHFLQQTNTRGGNVLTRLHDSIALLSGDKVAQQILIYLTQMSAEPYMEILKLWILKGVIMDAEHEFLIEENEKECSPDLNQNYFSDYWEKRYVIRQDVVPRFLEKQVDVILRTGKYLNVIRECGKHVTLKQSSSLKFSHTEEHYITFINDAYSFASKSLLELLMVDNDLMGRMNSVKRYFLLQQGDFVAQFMDATELELAKNVDEVLPMRLENLLELTLRLSSAKHDKYQDELCTALLPYGIVTQMSKIIKYDDTYMDEVDTSELSGIECFTFGYNVQWPVSIVLNQMAISQYQMIFRLLYYCKHVERILCRVWTANNNAKKFASSTAELYRSAFTLRQRMMNAIQNLEYYMMIEVIEPNWHTFMERITKITNIDDLLVHHQDFLDQCLKNCMITYPDLLKNIMQMCNICIEFCAFIESESSMAPSETFSQKVNRFDVTFTGKLIGLLNKIHEIAEQNQSDKFINLIHRINFNSYYTNQLDFLYIKDSYNATH